MEITHEIHEGHARLTLVGRFDATWSESVARVLDECVRDGAHVVRLDLAGVVYLSSAGLRVLLGTYRELSLIGGSLAITHVSEPVHKVLTMSGLSVMLELQTAEVVSEADPAALPDGQARHFECAGALIEQWDLDRGARMRVRTIGDPTSVLEGRAATFSSQRLAFSKSAFGLGIAAFGRDAADCAGLFGEFLAIGGAAICHADLEDALPDWLVAEGNMFPEAEMLWGLVGEGGFATQLRFEAAESEDGVFRLAEALELALEAADSAPVAVVMVAETVQLVGAALRTVEGQEKSGTSFFEFPKIRDRLLFTAEPAWAGSLALIVGVVAKDAPPALAPLLRPIVQDGSRMGHLHAAVFPYRPVRKGRLDLESTIGGLFEERSVRALLHLVNDWREPVGAGESAFTRGVVWVAPLEVQ